MTLLLIANYIQLNSNSNSLLIGEYDDIKEAEEEEEYYDDRYGKSSCTSSVAL